MKPLELTVYIHDEEDHDYQHPLHRFWVSEADVDHYAESKRFTDAELAAEHWLHCWKWERSVAENDAYEGSPETREYRRRAQILERFATLPHYDEAAS